MKYIYLLPLFILFIVGCTNAVHVTDYTTGIGTEPNPTATATSFTQNFANTYSDNVYISWTTGFKASFSSCNSYKATYKLCNSAGDCLIKDYKWLNSPHAQYSSWNAGGSWTIYAPELSNPKYCGQNLQAQLIDHYLCSDTNALTCSYAETLDSSFIAVVHWACPTTVCSVNNPAGCQHTGPSCNNKLACTDTFLVSGVSYCMPGEQTTCTTADMCDINSGTCIVECSQIASQKCYNGDVYNYDCHNVVTYKQIECGNYGCSVNKCLTCTPGEQRCKASSTTVVETCNSAGTAWTSLTCISPLVCSSGQCLSSIQCSPNTKQCTGINTYKLCNAAGNGQTDETCITGQHCENNQCINDQSVCTTVNAATACNDGNACTTDTCNNGVCANTPIIAGSCGGNQTTCKGYQTLQTDNTCMFDFNKLFNGGFKDFYVDNSMYIWLVVAVLVLIIVLIIALRPKQNSLY